MSDSSQDNFSDPTAIRFANLVVRHLDNHLSEAEEAALHRELRSSEKRREEFVELCLHAQLMVDRLTVHSAQSELRLEADDFCILNEPEVRHPDSGDSGVTPVLGMVVSLPAPDDSEEPAPAPSVPVWPPSDNGQPSNWRRWFAAMILIPLMLGVGFVWFVKHRSGSQIVAIAKPAIPFHSEPPVTISFGKVAEVLDAEWDADSASLRPGEALPRVPMSLKAGLVHINLVNGVSLIVQGPATFQVDSEVEAQLTLGKLTALVPPNARGFSVRSPTAKVIDLGTEFGMNVRPGGEVATSVFVGRVILDAGGNAAAATPNTVAKTLELTAGQSGKADVSGVRSQPSDTDPDSNAYVRDIRHVRGSIPVYSTGQDTEAGQSDPHWKITQVELDPRTLPGDAFVLKRFGPTYKPNDDRSKWISVGADRPAVAAKGMYTYTTTFDLAHFLAESAKLSLRMAVDDGIVTVRLNGQDMRISLDPHTDWMNSMTAFEIDHGFVAGMNRLELVVVNGELSPSNPSSLRLELTGSAVREVDEDKK